MKMIRVEGLVLREQPVKEQDRLVTLLTKEQGLVRAFANGARNPKNRNLAATSLLTYGSFSLAVSASGTLTVRESNVIESFFGLREDLTALALAQYFAEVAAELAPAGDPAGEMLPLLLNAVHLLSLGKKDQVILKAGFELRFCALAGFMPSLVACASCGAYETETMKFCPNTGHLYCENCVPNEPSVPVELSVIYAMRHICFSEANRVFSFRITGPAKEQLEELSERYLRAVSAHTYKTLSFYKSMKR